jgi:hypothetical protein
MFVLATGSSRDGLSKWELTTRRSTHEQAARLRIGAGHVVTNPSSSMQCADIERCASRDRLPNSDRLPPQSVSPRGGAKERTLHRLRRGRQSEMKCRCCISCANLTCVLRKGSISSNDSFVTRFTNSACSFSTSSHFNCTAATLGNVSGLNRASRSVLKSVNTAGLWDGILQYASQIHSPPTMCTSVSRTERKLPPRSRVKASVLSAEAACKTLLFAQRSYS